MTDASPDQSSQPGELHQPPGLINGESGPSPLPPGVVVSPRNGFAASALPARRSNGWNTFMKPEQPSEPAPSLTFVDQDEFAAILQCLNKLEMQMNTCLEAMRRVRDPAKRPIEKADTIASSAPTFSSRNNLKAMLTANLEQTGRPGRRALRPHSDIKKAFSGLQRMNTADVWNNDAAAAFLHTHRFGWLLDVLDAPHTGFGAYLFSAFRVLLVVISIMTLCAQSTVIPVIGTNVAAILETVVDVAFLVELILLVLAIPIKLDILRNPMYWPDVLVPFGLVIRASCGFDLAVSGVSNAAIPMHDFARIMLLCFLPVLRTFKLLRHFETYHLLVNAFKRSFAALPVLLYTLSLLVLSASAIVYWIEPRDNVRSLPHSMWFCIVTMSTVGYGDVSPVTSGGMAFVSVLVVIGLLFTAMPIGIVGHEFMTSWASRHRVMLINRTRKCLTKWGYHADDFEGLFRAMDANQDGKLDLPEFVKLMSKLNVGLNDETAVELFLLFDEDASGLIDFDEFLKQIYPFEYFTGMHMKKADTCHACNNVLLPDAKFCRKCGVSRKNKCQSCESILPFDASFCRMCGASTTAADEAQPPRGASSIMTVSAPSSPRPSAKTED